MATVECTIPKGGGLFSLDGGILEPVGLELPREALVDTGVLKSRLVFWGRADHPGGGTLQSPPMPEKKIISQVSPSSAWST